MDYDKVVTNLRAVLLSAKGGIPINEINQDFKLIIGENIPYRKLGYQSLETFLKSISGIKIINKGRQTFVEVSSEKSSHLSKLVSRQKSRKKKSFHHNSMPCRIPRLTRKVVDSGKNVNANSSMLTKNSMKNNASFKQEKIIPLLQVPTEYAPLSSLERPRYIQAASESFTSPSKKLKDRKSNTIQMIINQNVNKFNNDIFSKNNGNSDKSSQPAITFKPNTLQEHLKVCNNEKSSSNISGRLKINSNIPSHSLICNNVSTPTNSEILSPLSPAQLIGNKLKSSSTTEPLKILVQETNQKETVLKSTLVFKEDPRHQLSICAKNFNLPEPIYRILSTTDKSPTVMAIYAHVKIGSYGYSNYPHDASSNDEAQKLAAKIALKDLIDKFGSLSNVTETIDKKLIQNRIKQIVDTHMNGVFKDQIPAYYKQRYGGCLPAGWFNIIEECPEIILEKGADNSIILQRYEIRTEKAFHPISTKSDKILLNPIGSIIPGQLQLPEDQYWIVYVCNIMSTVDVWVRIGGANYSDKFDIMIADMMEYYGRSQSSVKLVEIGGYYAIFEDDSWHRVRCEEFDNTTGVVTVLFIDHGDEVKRSLRDLRILDKKFCSLPAQAIRVCLAGLEDLRDYEAVLPRIEYLLLGLSFYVEVLNHGFDKDGPYATVNFYDTTGPEDVNLNKVLYKQILNDVASSQMELTEDVTEVLVSYVDKNGDIYIQMQTEGMKYLFGLINRLTQTRLTEDILGNSTVTVIDRMKKYLVSFNGNWYRGEVANIYPNSQIKMFLIDFGTTVIVNKANLLHLEYLSDLLNKFPAQAIKVNLHDIEKSMFNEKMVSRLRKLVPHGQPILIKAISHSSVNTPLVEIFKRIQPDNILASINTTLVYEELERTIGDGNNNVKLKKRITSRVATNENDDVIKTLKPPKIAGIREFFDVHVTMAANPGNFTVQPLDDKRSLEVMMIELQKVCLTYQGLYPTIESIKEGNFYAAKHKDKHWYRVSAMNIIDENMVTVYFCDFGDVCILSLDKLQPLKSQFLELPYQAIKAKLVGIRPINKDWSVEDCLRFQQLVLEKNFVSIIIESTRDDKNPVETILGLKLIDVETSEDIFIDQLLVDENRAVFID
ncbi:PREDICTED: tudor domain-containing protein 7-like isoform X2 [Polistes canadensis]|uniref:tudor domain-containing protein 7-like isoform X2 n=1 Tax=Polistes canadensis TaxID=91411 RepID=UPI000718F324|nr:PREDICTED: tudor domain-containing protein 7-like isoform X2 [Polistes canadensis]